MARRNGTSMAMDLVIPGGAPSVTLVPSASVPQTTTFGLGATKQVVAGDNWPSARGICVEAVTIFDQASSGGSAVDDDQLAVIYDSFALDIPELGRVWDPQVWTGPRAKHVIEFISNNYRYNAFARAQIASTDGDTTLTLYNYLPFCHNAFVTPEIFALWTGWLKDMTLTIQVGLSTAIAAFSTGAAIKTSFVIKSTLDCVVLPQLVRPIISQWNRYTSVAASGNTSHLMQNVGQPFSLEGAAPGSRIAGVYELMNVLGLGGASTGNLFTSFTCDELGQSRTVNPWRFVQAYREMIGHAGAVGATGVTDKGGNPYTMAAAAAGSFLTSDLMYIPWRTPANGVSRPEQQLRWGGGNITLVRDFTVVPSSGTHTVLTNELRELTPAKHATLARVAFPNGAPPSMLVSDRALRDSQKFAQGGVYLTRR
ncbi:MAG TPA: hypothetical protein VJV75_03795 [Candidatus Polarisedimenticolia bacterium]|nr:hypothetical protein [Candidatus Polarisedimenticolia bacterium]